MLLPPVMAQLSAHSWPLKRSLPQVFTQFRHSYRHDLYMPSDNATAIVDCSTSIIDNVAATLVVFIVSIFAVLVLVSSPVLEILCC